MTEKKVTPFALSCNTCGASMHFDIVKQNYACEFCGNTEFVGAKKEQLEQWAEKLNASLQAQSNTVKKYECPNCGADVKTVDDTESLRCFQCGSAMITADFAQTDDYPVAIVPFKLTEREAKNLLLKELDNSLMHLSKGHKARIKVNIDSLRAIYLPFQLFSGPVDATVSRYGRFNGRDFHLKSYLNQKVVIACENIDNDLIEKIEPFNLDDLVAFEFIYISGHQAKTQDIGYANLASDLSAELKEDMKTALGRKLGGASLNIEVEPYQQSTAPVLMPIFSLNVDGATLTINGQTGKIAVKDAKKKVSRKWMIEPIIYIFLFFLFVYFGATDDSGEANVLFSLGTTLAFAVFIFVVYSNVNRRFLYNKFFASKTTYSREGSELLKTALEAKPTFEQPVFYEKIKDKLEAVKIKFFPLRLKITVFLGLLIFFILPFVINEIVGKTIFSEEVEIFWGMFAFPFAVVYYFTYIKQGLYDRVYYKLYDGDGLGYKYLRGSFSFGKLLKNGFPALLYVLKWTILFALLFIGFALVPVLLGIL